MAQNYFNTLSLRQQLAELSQCRFMESSEFDGVTKLKGKKIVIVGCENKSKNASIGREIENTQRVIVLKKIEISSFLFNAKYPVIIGRANTPRL